MGDSGHELAGFMLIVEFEGELLIVVEQLASHISFHKSAHDMPFIVDKCMACCVNGNQAEHDASHHVDLMEGIC